MQLRRRGTNVLKQSSGTAHRSRILWSAGLRWSLVGKHARSSIRASQRQDKSPHEPVPKAVCGALSPIRGRHGATMAQSLITTGFGTVGIVGGAAAWYHPLNSAIFAILVLWGSRCRTLLANVVNNEIAGRSRWGSAFPWPCDRLKSIFVSRRHRFIRSVGYGRRSISGSAAANEACIAVKMFGVEAVSRKSVSRMIIFAKDKRYDVKGDVRLKQPSNRSKWERRFSDNWVVQQARKLAGSEKATYVLKVLDPLTIEIWMQRA